MPVASGIGGGSADAAATLHAMAELWDLPLPDVAAQVALGADVPVCMGRAPVLMQGIGAQISPLGDAAAACLPVWLTRGVACRLRGCLSNWHPNLTCRLSRRRPRLQNFVLG